jgi:RimJ/RimL family protein N-acetyltransferase
MENEINLVPIDRTSSKDIALILDLIQKNYTKKPYPFSADQIQNPSRFYFKAFLGNELIGMTGIDFKTPTLAETVKTIILQEHRGKNFGVRLSQAIEDECRLRGIKKVISTIYADNHVMISIKLKQGYVIEGFHPDHEAPGFHEYSFGKKI